MDRNDFISGCELKVHSPVTTIKHLRILTILFLAILLSLPFFATSALAVDEERDVGVAKRELTAEEMAAELRAKAEEQRLVEGERVPYEDVLEDPDNIDLNFRYARQQVSESDLLSAAGTLERILMINPELAPIRFFYAVVLYRLDNIKEAERELNLLTKEELPENLRMDVEKQLKKIQLRRRLTRFTLRNTVGYGFDQNRNAAPKSKILVTNDVTGPVTGTSRQNADTNFLTVQSLNVARDLGFQAGHEVFGEFTYFLQEQTEADNLDLQSFGGAAGGTFKSSVVNVTPSFFMSHLFLSRETFLRTQGINVMLDRVFDERWSGSFAVNWERQNYMNIADNTTGAQREGPEVKLDLLANYILTSSMRLSSGIGYTHKRANKDFNAYNGINLNGSYLWLLGKGQFLIQSVEVGFDYYDDIDPSRVSAHRKDKTLRYKATYGVPLSFLQIEKILPKYLEGVFGDMTITAAYEFYRAVSNITNFTYNNHKYQGMLSKTWEF